MAELQEPAWLTYDQAIAIHSRQLRRFGGAPGLRDEGMLRSALQRPVNKWQYEQAQLPELAAAYAFSLAKNHAFVDGNKRTALATCLVFLSENGLLRDEKLEVDAWEALVLDVAASRLDREQTTKRLRRLLRAPK